MSRRPSAIPIVIVVVVLLVGLIGVAFVAPPRDPRRSQDIPSTRPGQAQTAPPLPTPFGRYPAPAEATIVGSCVSGIDPKTVPAPIAQAFCVCTLNAFEQLYPTYDRFQQAIEASLITDELRTQISNRCTQALLGG